MTTFSISEAKIKLAWREKYLTDGTNEQALAYPRGVYRGFWPIPRPVPDQFVRISVDPFVLGMDIDSFAIYADRTNGFSVSIRELADVDLDCAPLFPVVGATETWYVSIDVTYTPNVTTTANYRVDKVDPRILNPSAIVLGVMPMTLGDLVISAAGVYTDRSIPSPTAHGLLTDFGAGDEFWGLFDGVSKWCLGTGPEARYFAEPTMQAHAEAAVIKFQLSGTWFVGNGAATTGGKYFRLLSNYAPFALPLVGSDGGWIRANATLLQSGGVVALTPSADADAEGFYTDPWIQLDFTNTVDAAYTGTILVRGFTKQTLLTLANAPAATFPLGDIEVSPHAASVAAKAHVGWPDSLAIGTVDGHLSDLLGHVNDRIDKIHPVAAPAGILLWWRSNNVTSDANVTKTTISIYWYDGHLITLIGGYIDVATWDVVAGTGPGATNVSMQWFTNSSVFGATFSMRAFKLAPAAASTWSILTGWDRGIIEGTGDAVYTGIPIQPNAGINWHPGTTPYDAFNTVHAGTSYELGKHVETDDAVAGEARVRHYYLQDEFVVAVNCQYSNVMGVKRWYIDHEGTSAYAYKFTTTGILVYRKYPNFLPPTTPWLDASGWDAWWWLGNGDDASLKVDGDVQDVIRFAIKFCVPYNTGGSNFHTYEPINYRSVWNSGPSTITITIEDSSQAHVGGAWPGDDWLVANFDHLFENGYSFVLDAQTEPVPDGSGEVYSLGDVIWCYGHVHVSN